MSEHRHHDGLELTLVQHSDGTLFLGVDLGHGILNEGEVMVGTLVPILARAIIYEDSLVNDLLEQADDLRVGIGWSSGSQQGSC